MLFLSKIYDIILQFLTRTTIPYQGIFVTPIISSSLRVFKIGCRVDSNPKIRIFIFRMPKNVIRFRPGLNRVSGFRIPSIGIPGFIRMFFYYFFVFFSFNHMHVLSLFLYRMFFYIKFKY